MSTSESWESGCCRCGSDVQVNFYPGKRACHVTCGPCLYPEDWFRCSSCEMVTHCIYALSYLKNLKPNGIVKGCYFKEELTGEESLYHSLQFVNSQQVRMNSVGQKKYLEELKKENAGSKCLQK